MGRERVRWGPRGTHLDAEDVQTGASLVVVCKVRRGPRRRAGAPHPRARPPGR